ncbi:hypothetical protein C1646_774913 [Rhizophagus diaphanus]|nr:hypothetical protein C1646_774913 [Rhizophagus diaphanus] [Rhizophagus sp. MUCL 43196]
MSLVVSDTTSDRKVKRDRKESPVWDHFIKESIDSDHYSVKCNYCAQIWSRGRPEILKLHLALHCNEALLNVKLKHIGILITSSASTNRRQISDTNSSTEISFCRSDNIDQALIQFFVCYGIPFSTVDHLYFVDFIQKISVVLNKVNEELKHKKNLILGKSIYAFVIITSSKKQYIHTLIDTSKQAYTAEIEKILSSISPKKFVAIVLDAEAAMQMTRQLISETYPNILSICCAFLYNNIIQLIIKGNCCDSILHLKNSLKNVLKTQPEIFHNVTIHKPPYDMEYTDDYDTPKIWWSTYQQSDNFIQELALKMFAITSYQAVCEQVFSILNWMTGKRRTKFSSSNMDVDELETEIQEVVTAMINNDDLFVEKGNKMKGEEVEKDEIIYSDDDDDINLDGVDMNELLLTE